MSWRVAWSDWSGCHFKDFPSEAAMTAWVTANLSTHWHTYLVGEQVSGKWTVRDKRLPWGNVLMTWATALIPFVKWTWNEKLASDLQQLYFT